MSNSVIVSNTCGWGGGGYAGYGARGGCGGINNGGTMVVTDSVVQNNISGEGGDLDYGNSAAMAAVSITWHTDHQQ